VALEYDLGLARAYMAGEFEVSRHGIRQHERSRTDPWAWCNSDGIKLRLLIVCVTVALTPLHALNRWSEQVPMLMV